mmetsp:Transcript_5175/g.8047  ORF Transcript_5175/g.8047 Transcript_5175/m.8047 type:complete len:200 (-) Transcript_5175:1555-2154(-)
MIIIILSLMKLFSSIIIFTTIFYICSKQRNRYNTYILVIEEKVLSVPPHCCCLVSSFSATDTPALPPAPLAQRPTLVTPSRLYSCWPAWLYSSLMPSMPLARISSAVRSPYPFSAAYCRTSSVIFIEQNLGPHMEQKCALLPASVGMVSSWYARAVIGSSARLNWSSHRNSKRALESVSSHFCEPGCSLARSAAWAAMR